MSTHGSDIQVLTEQADAAILRAGLSGEPKRTALIALAFCDMLSDRQSEAQRQATQVARQFWAGASLDAHHERVDEYAKIIDMDQLNYVNRRDAAMNRLVWTALNTNGEFDGYACEFLINLGADAGLSASEMLGALSKHIPGLYAEE